MSFGIDVNILLYASDSGCPEHDRAAGFLQRCVTDGQVFCLAWITLMGYLRMATHPSIFARPLSPREATRNLEALLALPHCRVIGELDGFWDAYLQVTADVPTRGNLVAGAHLAAVLRQHGVRTLFTRDRDFRKFGFLDVRDPLDQAHAGQEIILAKGGKPYARLVPLLTDPSARQPGRLPGKVDAAFLDPLPDEELKAWDAR